MVPPTAVTEAAPSADSAVAIKDPVKDTILTPRFYTTDFEAMAAMDLRPNEAELEAICEEFRKDTTVTISSATTTLMAPPTSWIPTLARCLWNSWSRAAPRNSPDFCSTKS